MSKEITSLKSIIKAENINLAPESFGGELDPLVCNCGCLVCSPGCAVCAVCAGLTY